MYKGLMMGVTIDWGTDSPEYNDPLFTDSIWGVLTNSISYQQHQLGKLYLQKG